MKAWLAIVPVVLATAPALAQPAGPYKLVIAWGNGQTQPLVIDNPSQVRCEAAVRAVEREAKRREDWAANRPSPQGSITIGGPVVIYAFCIPG